MTPVYRLDELTLQYRRTARPALDRITYVGRPGVTGVIGANGAGKSTLLSVMSGSLAPTSGDCVLLPTSDCATADGIVPSGVSGGDVRSAAVQRMTALVPQDLVLPRSLRIIDFLNYMGWARGIERSNREAACVDALCAVGLQDRAKNSIGTLSGGMKRRLLIAQGILGQPRLLMMDEPTASLDPEQRAAVRELIAALRARVPAIVISSHEIADLASICDNLLMLEAGRVIFDGTPDALREYGESMVNPGVGFSPYEAAFMSLRREESARAV